MFEELLKAGHTGAEYDAWLFQIDRGDQFGSGSTPSFPRKVCAGGMPVLALLAGQQRSLPRGRFGRFYAYAPEKYEYPIDRFAMETRRQLDVLDRGLTASEYIAGSDFTIADMAIWPWYGRSHGANYTVPATFCRSMNIAIYSAGRSRSEPDPRAA